MFCYACCILTDCWLPPHRYLISRRSCLFLLLLQGDATPTLDEQSMFSSAEAQSMSSCSSPCEYQQPELPHDQDDADQVSGPAPGRHPHRHPDRHQVGTRSVCSEL